MNAEQLAERLGGKRSGAGWAAKCPAHEDSRASLSISEGEGGKVLLCCHAGCEFAAIIERVGVAAADLMGKGNDSTPRNGTRPPKSKPPPLSAAQVEAMAQALQTDSTAWDYVTKELKLDPEVVRLEKLGLYRNGDGRRLTYPYRSRAAWTFANCRALDGQEPRFRRTPVGQPTTLYRGDTLKLGGTAIVTEGERDAIAAISMHLHSELGGNGCAAVVAIPGVEQVDKTWAVEPLKSQARVLVAFDADAAGDEAARKLCAVLGPKAVRLRPPGAKDFGDLLASRGPEEALSMVLEAAKEAAPASEAALPFPRVEVTGSGFSVGGFVFVRASAVPDEQVKWLVRGFVPRAELTDVSGDPGVGKGCIIASWAAGTTTGRYGPPETVIMLATEDRLGLIKARLRAEGANLDRVVFFDIREAQQTPCLPADISAIEALVTATGAALVICDPALEFMASALDSHKQQDVQQFTAALAGMAHRTGAAVVAVRHLNKATGGSAIYKGAGSIAFIARARMALLVAKDKARGCRVLTVVKGNLAKDTYSVTFDILEKGDSTIVAWGEQTTVTADELVNQVPRPKRHGPDPVAQHAARDFLAGFLADGAQSKEDVVREAKAANAGGRTVVYQAAKAMNLANCTVAGKPGWKLPERR